MIKRNHGDHRPDPPERDEDCEPKKKERAMIWPFSTIYGRINDMFHKVSDILTILMEFRKETDRRLKRIEEHTRHLPILLPALDTLAATQKRIEQKVDKIMADLTSLQAQVEKNTAVEASALVLIQGIVAKLEEAKNDPVKIQSFIDQLNASGTALADAVAANTPAEPPVEPTGNRRR